MMPHIPVDIGKLGKDKLNQEILRVAIMAELDAINLYEQLAALTDDANLQEIFLDVAKEEKTHVGEFQAMLLRLDAEQVAEMAHGQEEVEEMLGKK